MTEIIVADEKHGTFTYSSALTLLKRRVNDGYWYYDEDAERAQKALESGDEEKAWAFLRSRRDAEYEWVEKQEIQ